MNPLDYYRAVWLVDTEFGAAPGCRPEPRCLVGRELRTGRLIRRWLDDSPPGRPAFGLGPDSLYVAYYASAELGCHIALDWPMPARVLDLYAEFRCRTSGLPTPCGRSLLGALIYFGLDGMAAVEKEEMRQLALRGGPYDAEERRALLNYCQSDVDALARLLPAMLPAIDLPRALLRGRYMPAAARMEWTGVPVDVDTLAELREHWDEIRGRLIAEVDRDYGVYNGTVFKRDRWAAYLERRGIPWPRLESEELALDDDTFREMARAYPAEVGPIRELQHTISQLKLNDLAVGPDGRNRVLLSAFGSKTGRNQPSNSRFIYGPSSFIRFLIKPGRGRAVAYCDWVAQEPGIAGYMSGDLLMQEAYRSPDLYLFLGQKAGIVPAGATKATHPVERERLKVVSLGVLYGLTGEGIARRLGLAPCQGRELLQLHQQTYRQFWRWSDLVEMEGMLTNRLRTVFGWTVHVPRGVHPVTGRPLANPRSLRNFPMQAHGAEMLRLACMLATERGVEVCCPVHDALLVEGPARLIKDVVARTKEAMREASELVLPGFPLRVESKIVCHPHRYADPRGEKMWKTVRGILAGIGKRSRSFHPLES
jgi:hypothetical protein